MTSTIDDNFCFCWWRRRRHVNDLTWSRWWRWSLFLVCIMLITLPCFIDHLKPCFQWKVFSNFCIHLKIVKLSQWYSIFYWSLCKYGWSIVSRVSRVSKQASTLLFSHISNASATHNYMHMWEQQRYNASDASKCHYNYKKRKLFKYSNYYYHIIYKWDCKLISSFIKFSRLGKIKNLLGNINWSGHRRSVLGVWKPFFNLSTI